MLLRINLLKYALYLETKNQDATKLRSHLPLYGMYSSMKVVD